MVGYYSVFLSLEFVKQKGAFSIRWWISKGVRPNQGVWVWSKRKSIAYYKIRIDKYIGRHVGHALVGMILCAHIIIVEATCYGIFLQQSLTVIVNVHLMRWLANINKTTLFLTWARFIPSLFVMPTFKSLPLEAKEIMQRYCGRPLARICE